MKRHALGEHVQQLRNAGKAAGDQLCRGHKGLYRIGLQQRGGQYRAKGNGVFHDPFCAERFDVHQHLSYPGAAGRIFSQQAAAKRGSSLYRPYFSTARGGITTPPFPLFCPQQRAAPGVFLWLGKPWAMPVEAPRKKAFASSIERSELLT